MSLGHALHFLCRLWGTPWEFVNPTIQVGGRELMGSTRDDSHRWFESQVSVRAM